MTYELGFFSSDLASIINMISGWAAGLGLAALIFIQWAGRK